MLAQLAHSPAWRSSGYVCLACRAQRLVATRRNQRKLHVEHTPAPVDTWFEGLNDINDTYATPIPKGKEHGQKDESKTQHKSLSFEELRAKLTGGTPGTDHVAVQDVAAKADREEQTLGNDKKVRYLKSGFRVVSINSGHDSDSLDKAIAVQTALNQEDVKGHSQQESIDTAKLDWSRAKQSLIKSESKRPAPAKRRLAMRLWTGLRRFQIEDLNRSLRDARLSGATDERLKFMAQSKGVQNPDTYVRHFLSHFRRIVKDSQKLKARAASNEVASTTTEALEELNADGAAPSDMQNLLRAVIPAAENIKKGTGDHNVEEPETSARTEHDTGRKRESGLDLVNPGPIHDQSVRLVDRFHQTAQQRGAKSPFPESDSASNEQRPLDEAIMSRIRQDVQKQVQLEMQSLREYMQKLVEERLQALKQTPINSSPSTMDALRAQLPSSAPSQSPAREDKSIPKRGRGRPRKNPLPVEGPESPEVVLDCATKHTDPAPSTLKRNTKCEVAPASTSVGAEAQTQVVDEENAQTQQARVSRDQLESQETAGAQTQTVTEESDRAEQSRNALEQAEVHKQVQTVLEEVRMKEVQNDAERGYTQVERDASDDKDDPLRRISALHAQVGALGQASVGFPVSRTITSLPVAGQQRSYSTQSSKPAQIVKRRRQSSGRSSLRARREVKRPSRTPNEAARTKLTENSRGDRVKKPLSALQSLRDLAKVISKRTKDSESKGDQAVMDIKSAMLGIAPDTRAAQTMTYFQPMDDTALQNETADEAAKGIVQAELDVPANAELTSIEPASLKIRPLNIPQPPVPQLEYGLDRVLFNPGIYQLQDPTSRVYNFDPYLQKIMPVIEFDFDSLKQYKTSSQDTALVRLAKKYDKKYIGSTSSMTSSLAHFHYLLSNWRPINLDMLTAGFHKQNVSKKFTQINRAPSAIFLRWKDGTYAIDADKEYDGANVLMLLGKSLELLFTLPTSGYERYRKSDPRKITNEEKTAPESYEYTTMRKFLMRSQLDAYDPRLPGTGTFDLKTRAVVSVRHQTEEYEPMTGYEIYGLHGNWCSYEKEFYDMIRSTMLKYMLQARMGRMSGIFVAYHNVKRMFGFQYVPIQEMDNVIHGQTDPSLGDQEFKASLDIMQELFEKATAQFPEQSLRIHFETTAPRTKKRTPLHVFVEPMAEEDIDEIQNKQKAKILEFESQAMGKTETRVEVDTASTTEDASAEKSQSEDVLSSKSSVGAASSKTTTGDGSSLADNLKPLFYATVVVQSKVNGQPLEEERPAGLSSNDKWEIDYMIETHDNTEKAWAAYEDCKARRRAALEQDEDEADAESEGKSPKEDYFINMLKKIAAQGRLHRKKLDAQDEGKEIKRVGMPQEQEEI